MMLTAADRLTGQGSN